MVSCVRSLLSPCFYSCVCSAAASSAMLLAFELAVGSSASVVSTPIAKEEVAQDAVCV